MVIQSVVPFMEGRVTAWNDQVASRRRGIGGRFMSISKRFVGFGAVKAANPGLPDNPISASGSYDPIRGYYSFESTEATMRQLADHAFMLRDWKLAYSTYEILRTDFGNDKAWKYHAAANEMAAISLLLNPQTTSSRTRSESIDQMLEIASYSYLTRCSLPFGAIRCLTIAIELLKSRSSASVEDAARWGGKLLELCVLNPIGQGFLSECIAGCYGSHPGSGIFRIGSRKRQTALWSMLASATWTENKKFSRARDLLQLAGGLYQHSDFQEMGLPFPNMSSLWERLKIITPLEKHSTSINNNDSIENFDQNVNKKIIYQKFNNLKT